LRLTEALDQGQSAIHFRIRVIKLFATLFLDEVAGAVNRQLRRDVVKDGTQLKLCPYQNRIGLAPREEHRKFELAQARRIRCRWGSASVAHVCYFNVLKRINVGDRDLLAERDGFEPPVPRGLL
jgi:hypothetical protein